MTELMRFWFFSGFLLAGAAWSLDTLLRGRGVQLRGLWASAMGLTVLSPLLPRFDLLRFAGPGNSAVPLADGIAVSPSLLAGLVDPVQAGLPGALVLAAWVFLSAVLLAAGAIVVGRIRHRARLWQPAEVRGHDVLIAPDFGPAVVGLGRPRIVLPESLYDAGALDLDLIMRHEREHIEARDPWLLMAAAVLVACMPWNLPLLWQATRLRAAVEEDCDLRVLRSGACKRTYGELLIRMASRPSALGFGFAAAAMSERRSGLRRRLERLRDQRGQARVAVTALLVIAGAGAIAVWMGMPSPLSLWHGPGHASSVPGPPVAPTAPNTLYELQGVREDLTNAKMEKLVRARALAQQALEVAAAEYQRATDDYEVASRASEDMPLERLQARRQAGQDALREAELRLQELTGELDRAYRVRERIRIDATSESEELKPIVFVDGERFFGDVTELDPDNVARIDVKGDAARANYGADGANGVIHIFLKKAAPKSN